MAVDRDGAVSGLYGVGVGPTTFFAYPGGIAMGTAFGELDEQELDDAGAATAALLAAAGLLDQVTRTERRASDPATARSRGCCARSFRGSRCATRSSTRSPAAAPPG